MISRDMSYPAGDLGISLFSMQHLPALVGRLRKIPTFVRLSRDGCFMDPVSADGNLAGGSRHRQIPAGSLTSNLIPPWSWARKSIRCKASRHLRWSHQWKPGASPAFGSASRESRVLQVKLLPSTIPESPHAWRRRSTALVTAGTRARSRPRHRLGGRTVTGRHLT